MPLSLSTHTLNLVLLRKASGGWPASPLKGQGGARTQRPPLSAPEFVNINNKYVFQPDFDHFNGKNTIAVLSVSIVSIFYRVSRKYLH